MRPSKQNRSHGSSPASEEVPSQRTPRQAIPLPKSRLDRLYDEARTAPDSEAGQMVRALLASGVRAAEAAPYEEGESAVDMGRERRRQRLASRRLSEEFKAEARRARAHAAQLQRVLDEVIEAAQSAQANKMDARSVCNYIAEVVGLKAPSGATLDPELSPVPLLKNW